MFENNFLEMVSLLIGVQSVSGDIASYVNDFSSCIEELNSTLKLENETAFKTVESGLFIAPVPFVTSGPDLKVAILGLNPLYHGNTKDEIEAAGTTWGSYAKFYTSSEIIRKALDVDRNTYYQNVFNIVSAIKEREFTGYGQHFKSMKRHEKTEKYIQFISDYNICLAESIPFRSEKTGTIDMSTLFEKLPIYKLYNDKLFAFLENNLAKDGWLVANGKAAKEALEICLGSELELLKENPARAYSLYEWKGRYVLTFHEFLRRKGGRLNSYDDIEAMFAEVFEGLA